MKTYSPWNSQPLDEWSAKNAQGKIVDLNGRKTHYIEKGAGDPVILLHGFNYDSFLWHANIDVLAEKFKVYALDLWGFGYSTREPLNYGYDLFADQVLFFMDSLGIEKASLIGQSMGGGTAIKFCTLHRQKVDKLILVAPAGLPHKMPFIAKLFCLPRVGEFFFSLNTDTIRKKNLADFFIYDKKLLTQSYFENATRYQKIKGTSETGLSILRKNFFFELSDEVKKLNEMGVPILIVWGRQDKGNPLSSGIEMSRMLENSQLEVFEQAGHVPNFEKADRFNELAISFLQQ